MSASVPNPNSFLSLAGLWLHLLDAASRDECQALAARGPDRAGGAGGEGGVRRGVEGEPLGALGGTEVRGRGLRGGALEAWGRDWSQRLHQLNMAVLS